MANIIRTQVVAVISCDKREKLFITSNDGDVFDALWYSRQFVWPERIVLPPPNTNVSVCLQVGRGDRIILQEYVVERGSL